MIGGMSYLFRVTGKTKVISNKFNKKSLQKVRKDNFFKTLDLEIYFKIPS